MYFVSECWNQLVFISISRRVGNWNNRIIVSINLNQENDNYNRESTLANPTEEVAAGFDKLEHAFVQENKHKEL